MNFKILDNSEGKMKNIVMLLLTLVLGTGSYVSAGVPIPVAKVSFEHEFLSGGHDFLDGFGALTVVLFDDGVVQVQNYESDSKSNLLEAPLLKQLSYNEFSKLLTTVYALGEAKLIVDDFATVCRMIPPLANSDLFLLGHNGEFQMVLSDDGCWRGVSVRPESDELALAAGQLRQKLISIGKRLLRKTHGK